MDALWVYSFYEISLISTKKTMPMSMMMVMASESVADENQLWMLTRVDRAHKQRISD